MVSRPDIQFTVGSTRHTLGVLVGWGQKAHPPRAQLYMKLDQRKGPVRNIYYDCWPRNEARPMRCGTGRTRKLMRSYGKTS